MDNKYVALAISESYIWQGFGRTEEEAKEALVAQWNEFFDDDETVENFGYPIMITVWIPGNGCTFEY